MRTDIQRDYLVHLLNEMTAHDLREFFLRVTIERLDELSDSELLDEVQLLAPDVQK